MRARIVSLVTSTVIVHVDGQSFRREMPTLEKKKVGSKTIGELVMERGADDIVALRHARQLLSIHIGVDRTGGRHCERLRRLHAQPHVGEPMLERLERADRAAERLAFFHVGERQVVQGVHRADTFGTLQRRRDRQLPRDRLPRVVDVAENGAGRQLGVFEDDVSEAAGDIEADEGFDPHTARAGRHEELRESAQRPGSHEDEIGRVGVLYESLRAPQSEPFARRQRLERDAVTIPPVIGLGDRPSRDHVAADDAGQMRGLLLRGPRCRERQGDQVRRQHRPGEDHSTQPLGDDRKIAHAVPGNASAPEVLRHEHGEPATPPATTHAERALSVAQASGRGEFISLLYWAGVIRAGAGPARSRLRPPRHRDRDRATADHTTGIAWNLAARSLIVSAA